MGLLCATSFILWRQLNATGDGSSSDTLIAQNPLATDDSSERGEIAEHNVPPASDVVEQGGMAGRVRGDGADAESTSTETRSTLPQSESSMGAETAGLQAIPDLSAMLTEKVEEKPAGTPVSMPMPEPTTPKPAPTPPEPPTPTPNPTTPAPDTVTPKSAEALQLAFQQTVASLRAVKYDIAEKHLATATPLAQSPEDMERLSRLQAAVEHARNFHQAIVDAVSKLQASEMLEANGNAMGIVETGANFLVLRIRGRNQRFELDDLPPGLAVILANLSLSADDPNTILGKAIYVTFNKKATAESLSKAREWFTEAAARVPDAKRLSLLVEDAERWPLPASATAVAAASNPDSPPANTMPLSREEATRLVTALKAARGALETGDWDQYEKRIAVAKELARGEASTNFVTRLQTWSEQVKAFHQAVKETVGRLKPSEKIQVGGSTELQVVRVTEKTLVVQVPGTPAEKVYALQELPLGLAMALALQSLPADLPGTKVIQAGYVLTSIKKSPSALTKAQDWYREAVLEDPKLLDLSDIAADNYDSLLAPAS